MNKLAQLEPLGLNGLDATEAVEVIISGKVTSEELVKDCLKRISIREKYIGAWQFIDPDYALEQARRLDNISPKGPLHGLPIGIKDNFDTFDMPTEYGTSIYPNHLPDSDTASVEKLRSAGAIILGKTVTSEFAGPYPGTTLNPYDPKRTPGVSSMGSAAGVADYMIPLASGTQTGGSVIRPAALCGVYGYKGSFNHLPVSGIRHLKPSIDTVGHFARSVNDLELMRCALTGTVFNKIDFYLSLPERIGICKTGHWHAAQPETREMINKIELCLKEIGASIVEIQLPEEFTKVMERSFQVIVAWELLLAHANEIENYFDEFNPWFRDTIKLAQTLTEGEFSEALHEAETVRSMLRIIFKNIDVIITPSALGEAPQDLKGIPAYNFNNLWTLMHVPCINLPAFLGPNNLPVGLQLVGPQDGDRRTLEFAQSIDQIIKKYFSEYPVLLHN